MRPVLLFSCISFHVFIAYSQVENDRLPPIITLGGVGFMSTATVYPQAAGVIGFRLELPRKSSAGFSTGLQVIASGDVGVGVPLLLELNTDDQNINLKLSLGVYAQGGAGQPFLFPTCEGRVRLGAVSNNRFFFDLVAGGYFFYRYDCGGSYYCRAYSRQGWQFQPGIGFAVGQTFIKKSTKRQNRRNGFPNYPIRTVTIHPNKQRP